MSIDARNSLIAWGSVLGMTALLWLAARSGFAEWLPDWLIWTAVPIMFALEIAGMLLRRVRARRGQA